MKLLRTAHKRLPLPANLLLADIGVSRSTQPITWNDVNWDTAGERVTG